MDRLLRLGGGMPGLNQGPPPSDAPVVDTAEQVSVVRLNARIHVISLRKLYFFCPPQGIHIVPGPLKNAETRPRRSTDGSDGSDARGVRRRLYRSRDRRFRYAANRNGKCRDVKVRDVWRTM